MNDDHVAQLVRTALDQFEDRPLAASARGALRIASLLGNTEVAHRLHLESRPSLSVHDRTTAVMAMYPDLTYEQARHRHAEEVEHFIAARTPRRLADKDADSPAVFFGSIDELFALLDQGVRMVNLAEAADAWEVAADGRQTLADRREIIDRIRSFVFEYLVRTEAQLGLSDTVSATLSRHRSRVDQQLQAVAPDLRDKLQSALRAARGGDRESRSHVLTTCRRVLEAVADQAFPAREEPFVGTDGIAHPVKQNNYRNRLLAAYDQSRTADRAFGSTVADLMARLERLDDLAQKGVHDEVDEDEMEVGLVLTYLAAGELIRRSSLPKIIDR